MLQIRVNVISLAMIFKQLQDSGGKELQLCKGEFTRHLPHGVCDASASRIQVAMVQPTT